MASLLPNLLPSLLPLQLHDKSIIGLLGHRFRRLLVDRRDFNFVGSHGSTSHVRFHHFYSFSDARLFLKDILNAQQEV